MSKKGVSKKNTSITVPANKKGRHIMKFLCFLRILLIPLIYILYPFRFYGNRKVKDGACLYVSNHLRFVDIAYPPCTTWEGIHYIAKKSLEKAPVVGWLFKKAKGISANRDGADVRTVMDALKCLKNGEKVCLYPEGTRNKTSEPLLPFKAGAAMLSIKARVPIVPILIYNRQKLFRTTHVLIGDPFEFSEYYDQKITEEVLKEADGKLWNMMLEMSKAHTAFLAEKKKGKKKNKNIAE